MIFIQGPGGRRGSNRRSSIGPYGSIKEMGLQHKIIDKIFFCMSRKSRIGLFFSIEMIMQVFGLVSLVSTIMLLIKIGFPLQAVILLLLSVRIGIRGNEKFLIINLLSMLVSQSSSYKPGDPRFSELRLDLKSGRWTLHFWRWLQWLNSWFCWGFPTLGRLATSSARFSFNLSNLGTAGQSVEFQHMCYQLCIVVPSSPLSHEIIEYIFSVEKTPQGFQADEDHQWVGESLHSGVSV